MIKIEKISIFYEKATYKLENLNKFNDLTDSKLPAKFKIL